MIADGAHNRDAARRLAENVRTYLTDRKIVGVMGVFKDKEYEQIAEIMAPYLSKVYTIDLPNGERNLGKERLCEVLKVRTYSQNRQRTLQMRLKKQKQNVGKKMLFWCLVPYLIWEK
ncbi:MAG: glutamate ligase domain-containing protein [Coprococcus sp.]